MHPVRNRRSIAAILLASVALLGLPASSGATAAPTSQQVLKFNLGPGKMLNLEPAYGAELQVQDALFAPLYRPSTSSRPTPYLATAAPHVSNAGTRYEVTLRLAKWSDGKPVLASDVVYAVARARKLGGYFVAQLGGASVSAPSERVVRFDLPRAMPWFDQVLASPAATPIPAHVVKQRGNSWTSPNTIVTSGAFTLSSISNSKATLARNLKWWGAGAMRLQRIEFMRYPQRTARTKFRTGALHSGLPLTMYAVRDAADDASRVTPKVNHAQYLYLNTTQSHLSDARVRRALALAVDRAAIAKLAIDPGTPLAGTLPSSLPGAAVASPTTKRLLPVDGSANPTRAAQLLAEAGWTPRPLTLAYATTGPTTAVIADAIRTQLAAAGVTVTVKAYSEAAFAKKGVGISPTGSGVDMVLQGWMADYTDVQDFHQLFRCASVKLGLDPANYCSSTYDTAYGQSILSSPIFTRLGRAAAAEDVLTGTNGDFPVIPLYQPNDGTLVSRKVSGLQFQVDGNAVFDRVIMQR